MPAAAAGQTRTCKCRWQRQWPRRPRQLRRQLQQQPAQQLRRRLPRLHRRTAPAGRDSAAAAVAARQLQVWMADVLCCAGLWSVPCACTCAVQRSFAGGRMARGALCLALRTVLLDSQPLTLQFVVSFELFAVCCWRCPCLRPCGCCKGCVGDLVLRLGWSASFLLRVISIDGLDYVLGARSWTGYHLRVCATQCRLWCAHPWRVHVCMRVIVRFDSLLLSGVMTAHWLRDLLAPSCLGPLPCMGGTFLAVVLACARQP